MFEKLTFEGKECAYRSEKELKRLHMYMEAVGVHRKTNSWHKAATAVGHPDYETLRSSCRNRLGYRNPRRIMTLDDVREAIQKHIKGGDADEIADQYGITKSGLFQRARNELGYYMATRTFAAIKDDAPCGMWGNILYSKILSYTE